MTLTIVTGNTKKFTEMSRALADLGVECERLNGDIEEIQDLDGAVVVRDKVLKAFALAGGRPVLVDDSGIYFARYNNFPGTYSKYLFKAIGYDGIFRLVQAGDKATFLCYVAYMDATLQEPIVMRGEYPGTIADDFVRDTHNEMPYAPMFIPQHSTKHMANMTPEERGQDHRHQALKQFAEWYLAKYEQQGHD